MAVAGLALLASLIVVEAGLRITRSPVRNWVGMSDPVLHHVHPPDIVYLMGDLFVEAPDVPYGESLAGRLEAAADRDTEIRHFGVWSYSPVLYLLQWRTKVRAFGPTHVVLVLFNNDIDDDARYDALSTQSPDGTLTAAPAPGRTG